jgi:cytochrome c oxidase assembly protein subunit 15
MTSRTRFLVVSWLCLCAAMVFAMVLLGGAVRLTGSGLSMVDWKPIMGMFPPQGAQGWLDAFEQYKQFPEFKLVNHQFELQQFKFIYLMEYSHRLLGRLIGLVFFIPFLLFLVLGRLNKSLGIRLWGLFVLGAIQGGIGWYMVKSGLVDNPSVSQYRLALHLFVAVLIYAYMVRCIVGLVSKTPSVSIAAADRRLASGLLFFVLVMIISGGFMAGTHAGFIYNTFPTMGGRWIPDSLFVMQPWWQNYFENTVTIQFFHRVAALIIFCWVILLFVRIRNYKESFHQVSAYVLLAAMLVQVILGISTLLSGVPAFLGVAHQGGALLLLSIVVFIISTNMGSEKTEAFR